MLRDRTAARLYAAALYGYIEHDFGAQSGALSALARALAEVPGFREALEHPALESGAREALTEAVLKQGIPDAAGRFFRLLLKRRKTRLLPQIIGELEQLYRRRNDIRKVEVATAFDLDAHEQWVICERITSLLKQRVDTLFSKDQRLIAGIRIRMGDMVVENSLRNMLANLRRRFAEAGEYTKEKETCR